MKSSRRGTVDPFIVMDVMEAARQAEDAGRSIIHMEVGQPGTPAPKPRVRGLAPNWFKTTRWAILWHWGCQVYGNGLPGCTKIGMGSSSTPTRGDHAGIKWCLHIGVLIAL